MALQIRYVPVNSSHMGKTSLVLRALREAGAEVRILCLDQLQIPTHHVLDQIQGTDYEYDCLPRGGYQPYPHWFRCALQRGKLVRAMESFLKNDASDLFVISNDTVVPARILAKLLIRRGVKCALIADGLQPPLKRSYRQSPRVRISGAVRRTLYGWGPRGTSGVHRILTMTQTCGKVLQNYGIPPSRVIVVGSPEYDQLAASRLQFDEIEGGRAIRDRLGLAADQPIIFYAHQDILGREVTENIVRNIIEGCRRAGATLLVKFHPRSQEDLHRWRRWADMCNLNQHVVAFYQNECTSIEAVQACVACVTVFSTVSLEALIYHRPLILLQYLPTKESLTFGRDYGAAIDVNKSDQIVDAVHAAVKDSRVREKLAANASEALRQELYGLDGRSVERIVQALLELAAER